MAAIQKLCPYTPKAPIRQGIYSQAVAVDRTMYISGQLGLDVASGKLVDGGVQAQARQVRDGGGGGGAGSGQTGERWWRGERGK
uniref:Uncharacterized protein n=1 Tax=Hucho hucho TaxID=62062 RepID=A0A4W5KFB2_9TELE